MLVGSVGNGGPITGCLVRIVTKYSGFQDACVRFSFSVLPFRKNEDYVGGCRPLMSSM